MILVGERLAIVPGALTAAADLARSTGARLAWVPRRAGDRGAVDAGLLPGLLPGGRPVADAAARADLAAAWGAKALNDEPGRDASAIIGAAASGKLKALVVGAVDPADLPDPALAVKALTKAFVVALEVRESAVTQVADVVFPVAPVTDKAGSFLNWEGRHRAFGQVLENPASLPDLRVLAGIAEELGKSLGFRTVSQVEAELVRVGAWEGSAGTSGFERADTAQARIPQSGQPSSDTSELVLSSWKQLIDDGRMQDGDDALRATARKPVVLVNAATIAALGVAQGDLVTLTGPLGSTSLPIAVADLADGAVWAPASAPGNSVRHLVGAAGDRVTLSTGGTK